MSADFTPYDPRRRPALLALWKSCIGERFPLEERLLVQNLDEDPHFDRAGTFCLYEGGLLAGFASARVCRVPLGSAGLKPGEGWLSLLLVHPRMRRRGLGGELLARALEFLKAQGVTSVLAGGDPGHFFPGVPDDDPGAGAFFEASGFEPRGSVWDFAGSLESLAPVAPPGETPFSIEPLEEPDVPRYLAFMGEHFGGRWRYEMERKLKYEARPGFLLIARAGGEVAGFANTGDGSSGFLSPGLYWRGLFPAAVGALGPIGMAAQFRGKGMGLALLHGAFADLRRRGCRFVVVDWTTLDDFYGKLGLSRWKGYRVMRRAL